MCWVEVSMFILSEMHIPCVNISNVFLSLIFSQHRHSDTIIQNEKSNQCHISLVREIFQYRTFWVKSIYKCLLDTEPNFITLDIFLRGKSAKRSKFILYQHIFQRLIFHNVNRLHIRTLHCAVIILCVRNANFVLFYAFHSRHNSIPYLYVFVCVCEFGFFIIFICFSSEEIHIAKIT